MAGRSENDLLTPWICQISRLSILFVGREMRRIGFGPGKFFLIAELYRNDGISQDELSRRVGVDKSNTSRALAELEKYGLIRRENDAGNHRVKRVFLEPKAWEIEPQFRRIQHQWNAELLRGFSDRRQRAFLSNLKQMADNAEAYFAEQAELYTSINDTPVKGRMTECG